MQKAGFLMTRRKSSSYKSRKLHKMKIYDHGLSSLLMQNFYLKRFFFLAIKMLSVGFAGTITANCNLDTDQKKIVVLSSNSRKILRSITD